MGRHRRSQDHYGRRAKKEKYAARSVYKLAEIQDKYKILKKGDRVLDLGCYPGSWIQYGLEVLGDSGAFFGIDLSEPKISFPSHVRCIEGSVYDLDPAELVKELGKMDVVLSDMAPATTGVRLVDQLRSHDLSRTAFHWGTIFLRARGNLVVKLFQGPDTPELIKEARSFFEKVRTFKPQGSRSESMETFLIAQGFLAPDPQVP